MIKTGGLDPTTHITVINVARVVVILQYPILCIMSKSIDTVSKYFTYYGCIGFIYCVNHTKSNTSLSKVMFYPIRTEVS